jgi:hypothetical protein
VRRGLAQPPVPNHSWRMVVHPLQSCFVGSDGGCGDGHRNSYVFQQLKRTSGGGGSILRPARRNGLKSLIRLAVWAPTVVNTVVKVAPWKPLYRRHRKRTRGQCAGVCRGATGCHIALPSGAGRDRHTAAPVKIGPHRCMAHDAVAHRAKLPAAPDGPHQSVSQTLRDEGRSLYSRRRRPELVSRYDGITKRGRNPNHRRDGSLM